MNLELQRIAFTELSNTLLKRDSSPSSLVQKSFEENDSDMEMRILKSIAEDDKALLLSSTKLFSPVERKALSKLLHLCCRFDSVDCASALFNGELGLVPLVNEVDDEARVLPIHVAAWAHAVRCLELLLRKHARTDLRSRDERALLPLEMALSRTRMQVTWNPDENSIEDLAVQLTRKDLTAVKLLSERTKEIDEVAYAIAKGGCVVELAALLVVAAEKVNELVLELHDVDLEYKERTTVYEFVIREALSLGRQGRLPPVRAAKRNYVTEKEIAEKRKLLLFEIELLQHFGAISQCGCGSPGKKVPSPLILASQAGDEAIVELLLKTNIDINDVDAEGNSALHCCLKTCRGSCPQRIKIMCLLLDHAAQVSHKNKLGLTAFHIAAGNGNSQALQVLIFQDPECVNSKTEVKETPLFFAVKNDHRDCVELLLRWGASTDVFNLRKQRPIDLAESQDMRFLLNSMNISLSVSSTNRAVLVPQKYTALLQGNEVETCRELSTSTHEGSTTPSKACSAANTEICKYFESPGGCVRGSKCFYVHVDEGLKPIKHKTESVHSLTFDLTRKIFVGGLPLSLDSDSLHKFFEEQFGPVDEAVVVGVDLGSNLHSRGFGFITFKHKKSVLAAVEAHFVTIMGKQVEIKSAAPKWLLPTELEKSPQAHEQPQSPAGLTPVGKDISPCCTTTDEGIPAQSSWIHKLMRGQPKPSSTESHKHDKSTPVWLQIFKKWLPKFLKHVWRRDSEYALSSLKADFRAACNQELDHVSLGFSKLSDFMRSLPDLCRVEFSPIGKQSLANHMILLPSLVKHQQKQIKLLPTCSLSSDPTSSSEIEDVTNGSSYTAVASAKAAELIPTNSNIPFVIANGKPEDASSVVPSRFLQFLKADPIFHARPWFRNEGNGGLEKFSPPEHLILKALAKERNNSSVFFLREFDFYDDYKASIKQSKCFGCKQNRALWANFPCLHLLWCAVCKLRAEGIASKKDQKCVVCDSAVQKMIWSFGANAICSYLKVPPSSPYRKVLLPS